MLHSAFFFFLLTLSLGFSGCGIKTSDSHVAIYGGKDLFVNDFYPESVEQYLATVAISSVERLRDKDGEVFCSGTYYRRASDGSHVVLTASHCLIDDAGNPYHKASELRVVFGWNTKLSSAQVYRVSRFVTHPEFDNQGTPGFEDDVNDVAVILLDRAPRDFVLPNGKIVKVSPFTKDSIFTGELEFMQPVEYFGFGLSSLGRLNSSGVLRTITNYFRRYEGFAHMRTAPQPRRFQSTCKGDSGGPSFVRNSFDKLELVGVHLGGGGFCDEFAVDTLLAPYIDWIESVGLGRR